MTEQRIEDFMCNIHHITLDYNKICSNLPFMDPGGGYIRDDEDPYNYFGIDVRGEKGLFRLSFSGSSDYFIGIHHNKYYEDKGETIDQAPVYCFNLEDTDSPLQPLGNFKTVLTQVLKDYIKEKRQLRQIPG